MTGRALLLIALALSPLVGSGCAVPAGPPPGPVRFDTATAWVTQGADSMRLLVEVARSEAQQEKGLSGRRVLDVGSGMVFLFDAPRTGDDGFWMWQTFVPLDIAFIDRTGTIQRILTMEPCLDDVSQDDCPGYFPGVEYASALEVRGGWFASAGFEVGARVTLER